MTVKDLIAKLLTLEEDATIESVVFHEHSGAPEYYSGIDISRKREGVFGDGYVIPKSYIIS